MQIGTGRDSTQEDVPSVLEANQPGVKESALISLCPQRDIPIKAEIEHDRSVASCHAEMIPRNAGHFHVLLAKVMVFALITCPAQQPMNTLEVVVIDHDFA